MIGRAVIAVAIVEAVLTAVMVTIALDIYAHRRVEEFGGVNIWGYRGAVAPQRQQNDIRIEVVGGTRAYGWGEPAGSLGSQIRRLMLLAIDRPGAVVRPVTVVNVGRLGALPDSYPGVIEHYAYLQPEIICIYDDLGVRGGEPAERSAIFELTGYAPALPVVLAEKGKAWRYGTVSRGYSLPSGSSSTSGPTRIAGTALEAVGDGLAAVDAGAARLLRSAPAAGPYADAMMTAIDAAHRRAQAVILVLSPAETPGQRHNAAALRQRLPDAAAASWLRIVDLDTEPRLRRDDLRYDGWNYGGVATTIAAEHVTPAVLSFIQ
ncbi:MAG TPA: hypothetical protein VKE96_27820 [Vicinamibacterales bacterium]|nr:hypothetical protein [Vicinamibacterales bacterium]